MRRHRRALPLLALLLALGTGAAGQTGGCNSSYSRYGLGLPAEPGQGFSKGMAGAGLGARPGNRLNTANPASYSALDSMSFIMDVGMSASLGRMRQGGVRVNTSNCALDYVSAGLRLAKGTGLAFGFSPLTTIGYSFSSPDKPVASNPNTTQDITSSNRHKGEGGLHQAFLGLGWRSPLGVSAGVNAAFVWGSYHHTVTPVFKEGGEAAGGYGGLSKTLDATLRTYKLDLGLQYPLRLGAADELTLGATVGVGHTIKSDATLLRHTATGDSASLTARRPFDLPWTCNAGLAWHHRDRLLVAADVRQEQWGDCRAAAETGDGYEARKGLYKNRTRAAAGAQWTPDPLKRKYWSRIQYRLGAAYATPCVKAGGHDGPREYTVTAGVGLPITNNINNRSVVNVALEWLRRAPGSRALVTEDYLMLHVGLTFNERWFMKYKIN